MPGYNMKPKKKKVKKPVKKPRKGYGY